MGRWKHGNLCCWIVPRSHFGRLLAHAMTSFSSVFSFHQSHLGLYYHRYGHCPSGSFRCSSMLELPFQCGMTILVPASVHQTRYILKAHPTQDVTATVPVALAAILVIDVYCHHDAGKCIMERDSERRQLEGMEFMFKLFQVVDDALASRRASTLKSGDHVNWSLGCTSEGPSGPKVP